MITTKGAKDTKTGRVSNDFNVSFLEHVFTNHEGLL